MSVALPTCAVVFGSVTPPQADVVELRVHLGATDEVSSFDCLLQNFDEKYSPGGTYPINVGDDGSISIGRGTSCPLLATITVEEIKAVSDSRGENYLRVLGRCWGERLFRKVVTKTYESQKGEAIVKDLIDNYVGLSHVRSSVELIEDTDTTYTKLEYENTPVFDILKYIAKTADKAGVIGFDFRVAPDGKFEFFPKNSKFWALADLVLYLSLNEGSGSIAHDESNKGNHGTITGASWVNGKYGKALRFDGIDDYVDIPDSSALEPALLTICFWLKLHVVTANQAIVGKAHYSPAQGYDIGIAYYAADNIRLVFTLYTTGGSGDGYIASDLSIHSWVGDGNWHFVVAIYDGSNMYLYANGNSTPLANQAQTGTIVYGAMPCRLGVLSYTLGDFLNGDLDDVRIYNRALTAAEIRDLFESGPPPLTSKIEAGEYRKDIFRKRDKIYVFGAAEKKYPTNGDSWTETLDIDSTPPNDWVSGTGTGSVSLDGSTKAVGSYSIKHTTGTADYYGRLRLIIPSGWQPNCNRYPSLQFQIMRESAFSGQATIILKDNGGRTIFREFQAQPDKWYMQKFNVGKKYADEWQGDVANFNWEVINEILWDMWFPGTGTGSFWVDNLFFNSARWSATYGSGSRELAETDEELHTDNECLLRAKALHDNLSSPAEYIKASSDVIDYGTTPILAADRIWVTLPNENVDGYYRLPSVEYLLLAELQTLQVTLEFGKEPPLLADYLYALRTRTGSLARYKIARV